MRFVSIETKNGKVCLGYGTSYSSYMYYKNRIATKFGISEDDSRIDTFTIKQNVDPSMFKKLKTQANRIGVDSKEFKNLELELASSDFKQPYWNPFDENAQKYGWYYRHPSHKWNWEV